MNNRLSFSGDTLSTITRVNSDGNTVENPASLEAGLQRFQGATLVISPALYGEDKVYGVKGVNTDLTWTRGTEATRTNSTGLIQKTPYNLFSYSDQLNNGFWTGTSITITANADYAPDGSLTADRLVKTSAQYTNCRLFTTNSFFPVGGVYTMSVFVKKEGTTNDFLIRLDAGGNSCNLNFNFTTEVTTVSGVNAISGSMVKYLNGWYRLILVGNATAGWAPDIGNMYANLTGDSVLLWGAQVVTGSQPLPYFKTTDRLDVPRIDYSLDTPTFLLEPQRTNLLIYSQGAITSAYSNETGITTTINNAIAPDGTQTAALVQNGSIGSQKVRGIYKTTPLTISAGNTFSVYLKAGTASWVGLNHTSYGIGWAYFNLSTGAIGYYDSCTPKITKLANGWYRCSLENCSFSGSSYVLVSIHTSNINSEPWQTLDTYAGGENIYVWGTQLEQAAYSTSYIPTVASTVTRIADAFSRNNLYTNNTISSLGGTWYLEIKNNLSYIRDGLATGLFIDSSSSSYTNGINIRNVGTGRLVVSKWQASSGTAVYTTTTDTVKLVIKWNGTTADVFANGTKVVSATAFTSTNMEFLGLNGGYIPYFIQTMALYNYPLSDIECINLTNDTYDILDVNSYNTYVASQSGGYLEGSTSNLLNVTQNFK